MRREKIKHISNRIYRIFDNYIHIESIMSNYASIQVGISSGSKLLFKETKLDREFLVFFSDHPGLSSHDIELIISYPDEMQKRTRVEIILSSEVCDFEIIKNIRNDWMEKFLDENCIFNKYKKIIF